MQFTLYLLEQVYVRLAKRWGSLGEAYVKFMHPWLLRTVLVERQFARLYVAEISELFDEKPERGWRELPSVYVVIGVGCQSFIERLVRMINAMQQLELSQEETTVFLQGMIDQRSALYDVLYNYILHLKLKDELLYHFPAATEEHPLHLSASLDQVLACVS